MNNIEPSSLSVSLQKNLRHMQEEVHATSDLKIRSFTMKDDVVREAAILYLDEITDTKNVQEHLLAPLLRIERIESIETIVLGHLSVIDVSIETTFDAIRNGLSKGKTLVLIDGFNQGILADSSDWQKRALAEPDSQRTSRGSMIGFTEQLKINLNLLRNMVQISSFNVETIRVGSESQTDVAIVYLEKFVDQKVLDETRKKIKDIDVTYLLEARVIEDAIEEKKTLFPLVFTCERPDVTVSALFEGRVVIFVNGTPYALIVPTLFLHYFHQPDEYNLKSGRFIVRALRFFCWFLSIGLLGLYVTMVRFHPHWLRHPFDEKLLTQSDTLMPILIEVLFLSFLFDLLAEVSLRVPKLSIILVSLIGAIVVGQTAVEAKLIHSLTLIVVGLNYLTSLNITAGGLWGAMRTLRYLLLFLGYFFGLTGMLVGMFVVTMYMASLRSLGVPYLAPFIPFRWDEMKDALIRGDLRKLINSKHTYPHKDNK
ncbi:spore germination protein [Neobacillus pocheonensis]|uniref:Spore germination protein n=1 Tax=Neobacillus pocheonensis TaxID=363869 RepID=A0ABT0WDW3_9BACI|nr:spore germination protein [Neobacillus pocheonensis]